jgi:hypothetical protein
MICRFKLIGTARFARILKAAVKGNQASNSEFVIGKVK